MRVSIQERCAVSASRPSLPCFGGTRRRHRRKGAEEGKPAGRAGVEDARVEGGGQVRGEAAGAKRAAGSGQRRRGGARAVRSAEALRGLRAALRADPKKKSVCGGFGFAAERAPGICMGFGAGSK
eukprot:gene1473-biopygen8606